MQLKKTSLTAEKVLLAQLNRLLSGEKLAPLSAIAKSSDIPALVLERAVARLISRGLLIRKGRGTYKPGNLNARQHARKTPPLPISPAQKGTVKWQRVHSRIAIDLSSGVFPTRIPLPTIKELESRYGANFRTMQKALHALEQSGAIVSHKRSFLPASQPGTPSGIVHCSVRSENGAPVLVTARTEEHFRLMEYEGNRLGVQVYVEPFTYAEQTLYTRGHTVMPGLSPQELERTLGFMIWCAGLNTTCIRAIIDYVKTTNKPLCLFDDSEVFDPTPFQPLSVQTRLFKIADSFDAGQAVGRYLFSKGHRRAAFFSPYHNYIWSQRRLDGLREGMGGYDRVVPFTFGLDSERRPATVPALNPILEPLRGWQKATVQNDHLDNKADQLLAQYTNILRESWIHETLEPLFVEAYADTSLSAWVGVSDRIALQMLAYSRKACWKVPRDRALIGFDNSLEALYNGLSSYSFNGPAIIPAMFSHLLASTRRRDLGRGGKMVSIEGAVMARTSA